MTPEAPTKGAGVDPLLLTDHDFELISNEPTTAKTRIASTGSNNDEIAHDIADTITERSLAYIYNGTEADLRDALVAMCADAATSLGDSALPGGKPQGDYMVTGLEVAYSNDGKLPRLKLQVYDGWTPAASAVYYPSVALPSAVYAPDLVANNDATGSETTGSTYTLSVDNPVDRIAGAFIAGDINHGMEQLQIQYAGVGDPDTTDFDDVSAAEPKSDGTMSTSAFTLTAGLARWSPA